MDERPQGPLSGVHVLELAGLGPVPFAAMMLADLGAEVIRVERPPGTASLDTGDPRREILFRGRRSVCVDLTTDAGREVVLSLAASSDVFLEGNRPGVAERLGIGPDDVAALNPAVVYARATGWGQDGPLAPRAGHDLTYTALSGALAAIGEPGRKPVPALNLISDFGGGGAFLVIGVLSALLERNTSGRGQVVDAAMLDGATYLLASVFSFVNRGEWNINRGSNIIDGGAPFYDTYECSDGRYVAIGALEPKFWRTAVETMGLAVDPATQWDMTTWPALRTLLADTFSQRPRNEWTELLEGVDACVAPILTLEEAADHPHARARGLHVRTGNDVAPAPAPRFSRTPGNAGAPADSPGGSTRIVLSERGFSHDEIDRLIQTNAILDTTDGD